MRVGLQIPSFTWPGGEAQIGPRLVQIAQAAEAAGFYSLWVMDHFFQIRGVGEVTEPMLESYSTLSFMAAVTKRVKLGAMVTGVVYRHPGILVKTVNTLDVLSDGRAYFGIGAAWNDREAVGLGVPFPPLKERFERLEETLQIAYQMWSGEVKPYEGKHYHLAETLSSPQPISKPHPPVLIGGMGEEKTFRLIAKYGDACNFFARAGADVLRSKLAVLRQRCEEVGRDYNQIEKTTLDTINLSPGNMNARQVIDHCQELAGLGFTQVIFNMPNVSDIQPLETLGKEVVPAVGGF